MQEIIETYLEKYLPRKDIIHRLPVSLPISKVWPELQKARKDKSESLHRRQTVLVGTDAKHLVTS